MSGSFIGCYGNTVSNGRINIPARFQKKFSAAAKETVIVTLGYNKPHIVIFPLDYWTALEKKLQNGSDLQSENLESYLNYASEQKLEGPGRIRLNQELLELTNISKDVIIKGEGNFLTVWEPTSFRKERERQRHVLNSRSKRSDYLL